MAHYLYRLGRFSARRAGAVIAVWVVILAVVVAGALSLGKPFSSKLTIPGTEFQSVLDDLGRSLPSAAGGAAPVVLRTADGTRFTTDQKTRVAALVAAWTKIPGVAGATDPFVLEAQRQQGARQVSAGQQQLAAASAAIAENGKRLAAGVAQLDAARQALAANAPRLTAAQLAAQTRTLEEQAARLAAGQRELAAATASETAQAAQFRQAQRRMALMDGMRMVNGAGSVALASVELSRPSNETSTATKDAIQAAAKGLASSGIVVDFSKDITMTIQVAGPSEIAGVVLAAVILLVMLGSLLAAGLPILTALIGVGIGVLGTTTVTHWVTMSDVTPVLALMLGLAVGIDYSLFLVHRHRTQLARGAEVVESIGLATGTAGSAVLFAGLTVVIALGALTLTGIPFLGIMGFAAAATVAVAVLLALTLTPALLRVIGKRVLSPRSRRALLARQKADENEAELEDAQERAAEADRRPATHSRGWGALVTRHPVLTLVAVTVVLGCLAIPAASLRLGLPDGGYEPASSSAYKAYTTIADEFGPGQNAAVVAVAKVPATTAATLTPSTATNLELDVAERLKATRDVAYVVPIGASPDRRTMAFQLVPKTGPSDDATVQLITDLRLERQTVMRDNGLSSLGYAGQTVANIDISQRLASALPLYLAVVVGISLILLLLVFRSVVVPLLATGGFLLSVAAALGSVVAVYQWGWLGSVFGVEHAGLILSFLPTLVVGILFGLAMDYQMFIVSGMREAWSHGHTGHTAVRVGFAQGARVVTAAALIMASVFFSFIHAGMTMIRPIGFALAVGILIDAFVVRMTAMPALLHLFADRTWYLPRWLDRIVPNLDVEGTTLEKEHALPPLETEPARVASRT